MCNFFLFLCDHRPTFPFEGQRGRGSFAARQRWTDYKGADFTLIYYQQDERGRWVEKAREPAAAS